MKTSTIVLLTLMVALFTSCKKFEWFDKDGCECSCEKERDHDKWDDDDKAEWDDDCYDDKGCGEKGNWEKDDWGKDYEKYVVEELVYNDKCECAVSGLIKYTKGGQTTALVDYGDGECDDVAVKTVCVDGDCEHEDAEIFEFQLDCEK